MLMIIEKSEIKQPPKTISFYRREDEPGVDIVGLSACNCIVLEVERVVIEFIHTYIISITHIFRAVRLL